MVAVDGLCAGLRCSLIAILVLAALKLDPARANFYQNTFFNWGSQNSAIWGDGDNLVLVLTKASALTWNFSNPEGLSTACQSEYSRTTRTRASPSPARRPSELTQACGMQITGQREEGWRKSTGPVPLLWPDTEGCS
ncbi:xyloglucan:xyloglucosyl transferase [Apostasia shenzhenica]|uniref:Xyloglucan:xyloglucosyl transferase n=1 Tax=Apostasia shenzhenica TaxID=1088818 RepID=A0A2I0BAD1_9ASPA|nr:xyloglucan:xyloglucosyl transferase [Apostasia shenzhenica]